MKKLCGIILILPLLLAAGTLRITDASRGSSSAVRETALEFSISSGTDVRIDRMSSQQAMMLIPQNTVDIAVFEEKELPESLKKSPRTFLGAEVLLLCVHNSNPIGNLTSKAAAEIFSSPRPRWSSHGGLNRSIHRYNLKDSVPCSGLDRDLFQHPAADEVAGLSHSNDVIKMVSSDPEALGFSHFSTAVRDVKILSIDGVFPDIRNIFNGRYPLTRKYYLVVVKKSQDAQKFVDFLTENIKEKVRKDMWLLPEEKSSFDASAAK